MKHPAIGMNTSCRALSGIPADLPNQVSGKVPPADEISVKHLSFSWMVTSNGGVSYGDAGTRKIEVPMCGGT